MSNFTDEGYEFVRAKKRRGGRRKRRRMLILLLAVLLLLIAIGAGSAVFMSRKKAATVVPESTITSPTGLEMDANAEAGGLVYRSQEEIQAELNQKVKEGMINISMNTSPVFEDSKAKGNLMIVNSEVNNYPQMVYIVRKDTGEEIYRSKGIPVGSKIEYAALDAELAPGSYDCVAYFNNVDMNGTILGTAGAEIVVNILK